MMTESQADKAAGIAVAIICIALVVGISWLTVTTTPTPVISVNVVIQADCEYIATGDRSKITLEDRVWKPIDDVMDYRRLPDEFRAFDQSNQQFEISLKEWACRVTAWKVQE